MRLLTSDTQAHIQSKAPPGSKIIIHSDNLNLNTGS